MLQLLQELLAWAISAILEKNENEYEIDAEIAVLALGRTGKFIANWTRNFQVLIYLIER